MLLPNIFKLCIVLSDSSRKLSLLLFIPADGIEWHVAYKHRRLNKVFMTNSNLWILSNSLLKLSKLVGLYHMAANYAKCEWVSFCLGSILLNWMISSSGTESNASLRTFHLTKTTVNFRVLYLEPYIFPNAKDLGFLILWQKGGSLSFCLPLLKDGKRRHNNGEEGMKDYVLPPYSKGGKVIGQPQCYKL